MSNQVQTIQKTDYNSGKVYFMVQGTLVTSIKGAFETNLTTVGSTNQKLNFSRKKEKSKEINW